MSKNTNISELINYLSYDGSGNIVFNTVSSATTNTDKFLVSDTGVLKFRTAAQLLSDIGAQASGSYQAALSGTGFVKISGSTISYDNSTYATETYVGTAVSNLVASSPATLDTLNELASALGNDANFATTVATSIGTKQAQLNGTGFVKISGTTISYDNSTYLTSASLTSYVPYTGATGAVNLGAYDLKVNGLTIGKGGGNLGQNVALGYNVLVDNASGNYNTGVGTSALASLGTGSNNTVIGYSAGMSIYSGSNNTIVGIYAGASTLSSNVVIADGAGNIRFQWDGSNIKLNGNTVGSNAYTSTAYLPLAGGTLTGNLTIGGFTIAELGTGYKGIQLQDSTGGLLSGSSYAIYLTSNAIIGTTGWVRGGAAYATARYSQFDGQHIFYSAAASSAGSAITWNTVFTVGSTGAVTVSGTLGIGVSPSYPLDMLTSSSGTFNTIAQFQNNDYTANNRSFIRVRQWVNAGGSSSSYFGTGQDSNLYIIANNSARGGDLIINAGTGDATFSSKLGVGVTPYSQLSLPSGNGWNGGLSWNYTTNGADSRRWWINTDQIVYGDFRICTEQTRGGGTINSAGSLYERFYIDASGRTGIGTTSLNASGLTIYQAGSDQRVLLELNRPNNSGLQTSLQFTVGNSIMVGQIQHEYAASNQNHMSFSLRSPSGSNFVSMWLKNDGNIGMGTNNPYTRLDVRGSIGMGGGATYPLNARLVKQGSTSVTFTATLGTIGAWRPGHIMIKVSGGQNGLQEYWAAWFFVRIIAYVGSSVICTVVDSGGDTGSVSFSSTSDSSNSPQTATFTLTDSGGTTNTMIADIDLTYNEGIVSLS